MFLSKQDQIFIDSLSDPVIGFEFLEILHKKHINYNYHPFSEIAVPGFLGFSKDLKMGWLQTFAGNCTLNDLSHCGAYSILWHVFTYGLVECLQGVEANHAFDSSEKKGCHIFFRDDGVGVFHIGDASKLNYSDIVKLFGIDSYVMCKDRKWSYIITHEHEIGPFFVQV